MNRSFLISTVMVIAAGAALAQQAPRAAVQDLPASGAAAPVALKSAVVADPNVLPAQTPIELQLETHLSTRDNKYGDGFAARVDKAIFYNGREVVPVGSILEGHVVRIQDERPAQGDSELMLRPDLLSTPDGQHYTISAEVIQSDPLNPAKVDSEGNLHEPRGMMTSDVRHTEIGAGGGVVAGAVLAGAQGALVGGGVGAAVVAGIWLVRHRHLDLNPGSRLTVRLDRPLQLQAKPANLGTAPGDK